MYQKTYEALYLSRAARIIESNITMNYHGNFQQFSSSANQYTDAYSNHQVCSPAQLPRPDGTRIWWLKSHNIDTFVTSTSVTQQ
jgi:hypothetical protein